MKIIKRLAILSILTVIIGSCFNPPEFSVIPEISFKEISFIVTPPRDGQPVADSLILIINFKDGDGDLGYDRSGTVYTSNPYHENDYYLEENGALRSVPTIDIKLGDSAAVITPIIDISEGTTGKLVTVRTRKKPGLEALLKPYEIPYTRTNYVVGNVFVKLGNENIFDNTYGQYDSIYKGYYVLKDTFYRTPNANSKNIEIGFEVRTKDTEFMPFNWSNIEAAGYASPFDERFPILSTSNSALEGTLRYAMAENNFVKWFDGKIMRLKIQIKDRALHKSNTIYTDEFTLADK